jgi:hypothetical protein
VHGGSSFVGIGVHPRARVVRPFVVPQPFGFYSPYFWSSPFSTYPFYSEPYVTATPTVQSPAITQNDTDLSYQVQQLSDEIERLRQQQALAVQAPPQPQVSAVPQTPPTVLVFRDGRHMSIQNYAVVGETLWVLDERTSTRVSIDDLDLDATRRENLARGVRFPLFAQ